MTAYVEIAEDQREKKLIELIIVLHNLRYWTKYWHQIGGKLANERKRLWEKRADDLLTELGLKQHNHIRSVYLPKE